MKRKIIHIDEALCNGCGLCLPNCPEGAIRLVDGKAKLSGEALCDGLGACLGRCPEGAITIEEREAEAYDEGRVMENVAAAGEATVRSHLQHLKEHGEHGLLREALAWMEANPGAPATAPSADPAIPCGCPGSRSMSWGRGGRRGPRRTPPRPASCGTGPSSST